MLTRSDATFSKTDDTIGHRDHTNATYKKIYINEIHNSYIPGVLYIEIMCKYNRV